jgi:hypothetical protein
MRLGAGLQPNDGEAQERRRAERHGPAQGRQSRPDKRAAMRAQDLGSVQPIRVHGALRTPQRRGTTNTAVDCED